MALRQLTILLDEDAGASLNNIAQAVFGQAAGFGFTPQCRRLSSVEFSSDLIGDNSVIGSSLIAISDTLVPRITKYLSDLRARSFLAITCMNPTDAHAETYVQFAECFRWPFVSGIPVAYVSLSPYARDTLGDFVRREFAPSTAAGILKQNRMVTLGIDDGFVPGNADRDKLIVPYSRWDEESKNILAHASLTKEYTRRMSAKGVHVSTDFYLHPDFQPLHSNDVYSFQHHLGRTELKAIVPSYGMFLCTAVMESFGLFYLELLSAGCVGVFLEAPWIRHLLPNYRYIVSDNNLIGTMLAIREGWADARAYVINEVRADILTRYDMKSFAKGILGLTSTMSETVCGSAALRT